ncbi:hypothetical protein Y1Q_0020111 [Alligator mississippiensis]|uniref:Uncharacterized protein n=1 Tax=Alligator mississippiensis TaxID=8496 RepID=A0A151LZ15_ALLMI|nr:hypothetical protein Y1Q_0020111 [Alligator mississippiensis]
MMPLLEMQALAEVSLKREPRKTAIRAGLSEESTTEVSRTQQSNQNGPILPEKVDVSAPSDYFLSGCGVCCPDGLCPFGGSWKHCQPS